MNARLNQGEELIVERLRPLVTDGGWRFWRNVQTRSQREYDLILAHSVHGVLLIEVKGGTEFVIEKGKLCALYHGRPRDVFQQVWGQHKELLKLCREYKMGCSVNWCVALPRSNPAASFVHDDKVLRAADLADLGAALERIARSWDEELRKTLGSGLVGCVDYDFTRLTLAFEWDRTPRILDISHDLEGIARLTEEQLTAAGMVAGMNLPRVTFTGGAGSGKTVLAMKLAEDAALEGRRVLYLCFNKALRNWLWKMKDRRRWDVGGLYERVKLAYFHRLAHELCGEAGLGSEWDAAIEADRPDGCQRFWRETSARLMQRAVDELGIDYDLVIVDEGQDFCGSWWPVVESLRAADGRLIVFTDEKQDLFGAEGVPERLREVSFSLKHNVRSTRAICGFINQELAALKRPVDLKHHADRAPGVEPSRLGSDELEGVVAELLAHGYKPAQMAFLGPFHLAKSSLVSPDGLAGLPLVDLAERSPGDGELLYSTIKSYKGLEADFVFILDETRRNIGLAPEERYVGYSRARTRLYVVS